MMNDCLFIGGESDGELKPVRDGMHTLRVMRSRYLVDANAQPHERVAIRGEFDDYRRLRLSANGRVFSVFILESLSDDEALAMLIKGYANDDCKR
jgi:hypothetical protein